MASQVKDWFDSYVHKDDEIAMAKVTNLTQALNQFTTQTYVDSRLNPDVVEGSNIIQYDVPAHRLLRSITVRTIQDALIKIGYTPGGDEVMQESQVQAGRPLPIQLNLEDDFNFSIYISGLPDGTNVKFYKS